MMHRVIPPLIRKEFDDCGLVASNLEHLCPLIGTLLGLAGDLDVQLAINCSPLPLSSLY